MGDLLERGALVARVRHWRLIGKAVKIGRGPAAVSGNEPIPMSRLGRNGIDIASILSPDEKSTGPKISFLHCEKG